MYIHHHAHHAASSHIKHHKIWYQVGAVAFADFVAWKIETDQLAQSSLAAAAQVTHHTAYNAYSALHTCTCMHTCTCICTHAHTVKRTLTHTCEYKLQVPQIGKYLYPAYAPCGLTNPVLAWPEVVL